MTDLNNPQPPEHVLRLDDEPSGLRGVIVVHSTRLGPAAGGCRFWNYDCMADACTDAVRLAEGMSYKNALADLPMGGGKAVIVKPRGDFDRVALFRAYGRAVESLGGSYVTAEDVGTSVPDMAVVAAQTRHVAGLEQRPGQPGGDPSPWTALGVFQSMEVAVQRRLGTDLRGVTVAVQGIGNVGYALCRQLHGAGARLYVAEPRAETAARAAAEFGARVMNSEELLRSDADVFAPCALGAVLDARTVRLLNAKVVCGAANNQLAARADGERLADRNILYAPDYLVNSGGVINVAGEYLGWSQQDVVARVNAISSRLANVLDMAVRDGIAPHDAADKTAQSIIERGACPTSLAA